MSCRPDSGTLAVRFRGHLVTIATRKPCAGLMALGFLLCALSIEVAPAQADDPASKPAPAPPATVERPVSQPVFERDRLYQAPGGEIRFVIPGTLDAQPKTLRACMRWKPPGSPVGTTTPCQDPAKIELPVYPIGQVLNPPGTTYALIVAGRPAGKSSEGYGVLGIVPAAQLEIVAEDPVKTGWHVVRDFGITSRLLAACNAILAVVIAGALLYSFALYLNVPGPPVPETSTKGDFIRRALRGFSIPLRIISKANGWASLSQLQIVLWTFVVGAGAIYVMTLTGSLIPISTGTLALLGIAGAAGVLSEVKNNQQDQSSMVSPPGPVTSPELEGPPRENEITVVWSPPVGAAPPLAYLVQYEDPPDTWRTVSRDLRQTRLRIVGLSPGTAYRIRILASNAAGLGAETLVAARTAAAAAPAQPLAPAVTGLTTEGDPTGTSLALVWDPAVNPAGPGGAPAPTPTYAVDRRPHDGDAPWTSIAKGLATNAFVASKLTANTAYDFRVRTETPLGAWSSVATFRSGVRIPKWSDIVTDTDRPGEIDVTRVQMLFFTVISAVFVSLNIIRSGAIPEIDPTYVTLMGISNGLYVTAKFVRP